jgi:hypothetical protein
MELTKTEILAQINNMKSKHELLKKEVFDLVESIKEGEEKINTKLKEIEELEIIYVDLIEKLAK